MVEETTDSSVVEEGALGVANHNHHSLDNLAAHSRTSTSTVLAWPRFAVISYPFNSHRIKINNSKTTLFFKNLI